MLTGHLGEPVTPWTLGYYQALGIARSWAEKARLPSIRRMWETNPGPGRELPALLGHEERTLLLPSCLR
jgi:hypothetical protein